MDQLSIERVLERAEYNYKDSVLWTLFFVSACAVVWSASALVSFRSHPGEWYLRTLQDDHTNRGAATIFHDSATP